MEWPRKCDSVAYDRACSEYDSSNIVQAGLNESDIECASIYVSKLNRSWETAGILFPDREYIEANIGEVPLKSYKDSSSLKPLWVWNFLGRFQWYFNNRRQDEVKAETVARCEQVINKLSAKGDDCVLVTHGFFMRTLVKCLKKQGYHVKGNSIAVGNLQVIVAECK